MFAKLGQRSASIGFKPHMSKAGYMTSSQAKKHVPSHVLEMLKKDPPLVQKCGVGECHTVTSSNRAKYQRELADASKMRVSHFDFFTKSNAELVAKGNPALVHGYGTATDESDWRGGDHAVLVLSLTKDSAKAPIGPDSEFVVADPDTTHDPRTSSSSEPWANLRIMTFSELQDVRPKIETDLMSGDYNQLAIVSQAAPKTGFLAGLKKLFGFGE